MKLTFEMLLCRAETPSYSSRAATLFRAAADALDIGTGPASLTEIIRGENKQIDSLGGGVKIGLESLVTTEIDSCIAPMNEDR